jgi:TRAP-type uncharacterized transport system substrate-binding protein
VTELRNHNPPITLAIGPIGSGSQVTWNSFILADSKYDSVLVDPVAGMRAVDKVKDGTDVPCMLFTSGIGSQTVKTINDAAQGKIKLVRVDDGDFGTAKDEKGEKIYTYTDIPGGTYKNIQDGLFSSSVATVAVPAVLILNTSWEQASGDRGYLAFSSAVHRLTGFLKLHGLTQ